MSKDEIPVMGGSGDVTSEDIKEPTAAPDFIILSEEKSVETVEAEQKVLTPEEFATLKSFGDAISLDEDLEGFSDNETLLERLQECTGQREVSFKNARTKESLVVRGNIGREGFEAATVQDVRLSNSYEGHPAVDTQVLEEAATKVKTEKRWSFEGELGEYGMVHSKMTGNYKIPPPVVDKLGIKEGEKIRIEVIREVEDE